MKKIFCKRRLSCRAPIKTMTFGEPAICLIYSEIFLLFLSINFDNITKFYKKQEISVKSGITVLKLA